MISSRAMTPTAALIIASVANFIGPFVFGVAVAKTIGQDVASPDSITIAVVLAAWSVPASGILSPGFLAFPPALPML